MRVRFAPSPTGQLHVGNARTALFNWLLARGTGGTFVLRIEDTDVERSTRESEARHRSRTCAGWGSTGTKASRRAATTARTASPSGSHIYRAHAVELLSRGARLSLLLHRRSSSRRIGSARCAQGLPPKYAGRCRDIPPRRGAARVESGEPAVDPVPRARRDRDVVFDDVVRGRGRASTPTSSAIPCWCAPDGMPAYNFAVVIDDALMGITHVVRGEDHISNTPRQMLLYEAFGWTPPAFAHVSLVLGPDHAPLSKRHGATSVAEFRARGYLPEALTNYLALHRLVAGRRRGDCCRSTSWRAAFASKTSGTAPACSTPRSWRG